MLFHEQGPQFFRRGAGEQAIGNALESRGFARRSPPDILRSC